MKIACKSDRILAECRIQAAHEMQLAGDLHGAATGYQRALEADPNSHAAYNNLGTLFASLGNWKHSLIFFEAAAALNPDSAEIHANIGNCHFEMGLKSEAVQSFQRAVSLAPEAACYYTSLGNGFRALNDFVQAECALGKALHLDPTHAEAHVNLGATLFEQQHWQAAEASFRRAIDHKPDLALAHVNLSNLLLRKGDFAGGWAEYEWRWKWNRFTSPKRSFQVPQWQGEDLRGARIFLHAEQGFGDTLQMLRYISMVAERGGIITLEVHPELQRIARGLEGVSKLIVRGEAVPECDYHCPLMSLPLAFGTTPATIPAHTPYLFAQDQAVGWIEAVRPEILRVGLVWAGSPKNVVDQRRSLALEELAPLSQVGNVRFFSLQPGASHASPDGQATAIQFGGHLPASADFADTAAAIRELDLVIAVDTAVAHLAGALGKPVWILLPTIACWRWLTEGESSPWYPQARLFRQDTSGDWTPAISRVRAELHQAAMEKSTSVLASTRVEPGGAVWNGPCVLHQGEEAVPQNMAR